MPTHSYHQFPPTFLNQSPPADKLINTQSHVGHSMTIIKHPTSTTLRFLSSINSRRFQYPRRRFLLVNGSVRFKPMATKLEETMIKGAGEDSKKGGKGEESGKGIQPPPPPPPEKPEPGDCCGSGCVRCVWDVYYEELEAYNKLYKSDSNGSKSNSS
ncbi:uncharacterized protein LOC108485673 [Gossypium arboreum]|uniref:Oxidoreductase-like domain-containing protein n=1 Tax=Gossypium arboreum TaxID=29729 RepID=A0ABR0QXN0_GOSAR|nr:uncharacterized protein LOC108485673 [Gossypium arboreum]KAK5843756.1 hypothetical protein PVK06_006214 [Gossypium arboreum]